MSKTVRFEDEFLTTGPGGPGGVATEESPGDPGGANIMFDYRIAIAFVIIVILIVFIILVWLFLDANSQTNKINNQTALLSSSSTSSNAEIKGKCLNDPLCTEISITDKSGTQNKLWKVFSRDGKDLETFDNFIFLSKYKWEFTQEFALQQPGTIRIEKGKVYKLDFIPQKVFGNFNKGIYSKYEITNKNLNSILSPANVRNVYHHFSDFELPWKNLDNIWVLYE